MSTRKPTETHPTASSPIILTIAIAIIIKATTMRYAGLDKLKNDDPEVDIYQGAWGTGSDPSPTGLYGPNSAFNYTRFESEENTKLLDAIDSKASFDEEKRKKAFYDWQEYAIDEAFVIPTLYRNEVLPVNDRVVDFTWAVDTKDNPWATVGVTAEKR